MQLHKFSYKEYENNSRFWDLKEFRLNKINLIVGSNTSGKSRTLNVINALAKLLLSSKIQLNSGTYKGEFIDNDIKISYSVEFKNGVILSEILQENDEVRFKRDKKGLGEIYNSDLGVMMKFEVPHNQLVVSRRDRIQFPYLEKLFLWASNTRHFRFSKEKDKGTLSLIESNQAPKESYNLNESVMATDAFRRAKGKFRDTFVSKLIEDFNRIGYDISGIDVGVLHSIKVDSPLGHKLVGLRVNENDRKGVTDQHEMSDGMFRALSILIHYNFYILERKKLNILIDDIGEGLDFERSTKLIKLLIEKSIESPIQLIMTSNDQFIMNNTNLDYWQIISRKGPVVRMFNRFNSEKEFEDFKFTGLTNFDFYSMDIFKSESGK